MGCLRAPSQASQFGLQAPAELGCALASKAAAVAASKAAAVVAFAESVVAAAVAVSLAPVVGLLGRKDRGGMRAFPWLLVLARRLKHKVPRSARARRARLFAPAHALEPAARCGLRARLSRRGRPPAGCSAPQTAQ